MRSSFLFAAVAATVALLAIALRLAWISDDAYITLRTVENMMRGDGMRWNAVDRVQTFTHPLWLLLLAAARVVSGEVHVTTIVVSLLVSTLAIGWLLASARTVAVVLATAIVLAGTRAFMDFTSSGLETPLSAFLLVAFVRVVTSELPPVRRFGTAVLLASLLAVTRMDLVLLAGPAVLATLHGVPWRAAALRLVVAAAPLWAWLVFATIWFGHPLPVTAHAKLLDVGVPLATMVAPGAFYVWFAVGDDPLLAVVTLVGIVVGAGDARTRWLALGMLLYVGYVVRIGGDFMAGRMLLPPFVVAIAVLARWLGTRGPSTAASVALAALVLIVARGAPAWLVAPADEPQQPVDEIVANRGICDERRFYARRLGLFGPNATCRTSTARRIAVQPANGGSGSWALRASPAFAPGTAGPCSIRCCAIRCWPGCRRSTRARGGRGTRAVVCPKATSRRCSTATTGSCTPGCAATTQRCAP
jgi:arabinofuranosyltransferase